MNKAMNLFRMTALLLGHLPGLYLANQATQRVEASYTRNSLSLVTALVAGLALIAEQPRRLPSAALVAGLALIAEQPRRPGGRCC
jgi:hypothetical protein